MEKLKFLCVGKFDVTEKLEVWRKKLESKQGLIHYWVIRNFEGLPGTLGLTDGHTVCWDFHMVNKFFSSGGWGCVEFNHNFDDDICALLEVF